MTNNEQRLKDETATTIPGIMALQFEDYPLSTPNSPTMLIRHAQDNTRGTHVKLIYHFTNVSIKDMNEIGKVLWELVHKLDIKTALASASPSPIFRNQWDFMFMDIPAMQAPLIRAQIIQTIAAHYAQKTK